MKSNWFRFLQRVVFFSLLFCLPVAAQEENDISAIKNQMAGLGFENIQVSKASSGSSNYIISFENRTFLHEIHAIGTLLSGLKNVIKKDTELDLYLQSNGLVISRISLKYSDYLNFKNKTLTEDEFAEKLQIELNPPYRVITETNNSLFLHTDLVLAPSYILDTVSGPSILFSPYINTFLDRGWMFATRFRAPVYNVVNGFDYQSNFKLISPSFTQTNFDFGSPLAGLPAFATFRVAHTYDSFIQAHHVVAANELQFMMLGGLINLNVASGVNFNLATGIVDFSALPYAQVYIGRWDLVVEGGGGKFLNNNYGGWGRVTRQFDNVDIGFSLYRTFGTDDSGWRMNFEFNIAIGPEHGIHAGAFRVTYPRFFAGSLTAGSFTGISLPVYKPQDFVKRLYPEYIKTHLYYWLEEK